MNAYAPKYLILSLPGKGPRMLAGVDIGRGKPIMSYSAQMCVLNANGDISRVSHSCIPNAFQHWDPDSHEMVLRALGDISEGTEITISYEQDITTFLKPKQERIQAIRESFDLHITCTCSACGPENSLLGTDDAFRVETAILLEMIKPLPLLDEDFELSIHPTHINLSNLQTLHEQYIRNLIELGAKDQKLCHAYWLLYQLHLYIADHASQKQTKSRCKECNFAIHPLTHLEAAVAALQNSIDVSTTCYGINHHKVSKLETGMRQLRQKTVDVLSRHFH